MNRVFRPMGEDGASLDVPHGRSWWRGFELCKIVKERKQGGDCLAMRVTVLSRSRARKRPTSMTWEEEFVVGPLVVRVLVVVLSQRQYDDWDAIDALFDSIDEKMAAA